MRSCLSHRALHLLATSALAVSLAACGGSTSDGAGAASAGAARTVTDVDGTTMTVPVHPKRVVTLSEPTLDDALALGVTPIGSTAGRGQSGLPGYLSADAAGVGILGAIGQPDYEAIAAAKPDLILVDGTSINNNADALAILRRIAPTYNAGYAGGDWRANLEHAADALNLGDEATKVEQAYDAKAAAVRAELAKPYAGKTFSVVRWQGSSAALILKELPAGVALTDLGLARPTSQDHEGRGHSEPVSLENLQQIDADYLFLGTLGGSSVSNADAGGETDARAAQRAITEAAQIPGFTQLTAYRSGHVIPVDGSLWTSTGGPLLMERLIESVQEELS